MVRVSGQASVLPTAIRHTSLIAVIAVRNESPIVCAISLAPFQNALSGIARTPPQVLRDAAGRPGEKIAVLVQQQRAARVELRTAQASAASRNDRPSKARRSAPPIAATRAAPPQRAAKARWRARIRVHMHRLSRPRVSSSRRAKPERRARPRGHAARRDDNPPGRARKQAQLWRRLSRQI